MLENILKTIAEKSGNIVRMSKGGTAVKNYRWVLFSLLVLLLLPASAYANENPFDENTSVTIAVGGSVPANVTDVETAKAAGVEAKEGFPVDGSVSVGNSTLRMRSWPWGDVLSTYRTGASVKVLGVSGEFYLVEVDGQQGYMHKNYVSIPGAPASGEAPSYPGDTASGGSLSLTAGVQVSKDAASGKKPAVASADSSSASSDSSADSSSTSSSPEKPAVGSGGKVVMNVPQKCQMKVKCPAPGSACGPTSLAMILAYYTGKNVDALASDLWYVCGATAANGTGHSGLQKGAKKYGYPNAKWHYSVSQSWLRTQLKAGKPVLAHVKGHYVVIKGIDDSGRIYFNDPGRSKVDRSMSFSEFSAWWRGAGATHPCMVLE